MNEGDLKRLEEIEQLQRDYVSTFSSDSGKRVLQHLKKMCFFNQSTYNDEALRMAFNEGQRYIVIHTLNMINWPVEEIRKLAESELAKGEPNV